MGFFTAAALNKQIIGLIREALITRTNREDPRGLWVNSLEEREVLCVWGGGPTALEVDKSPLCPWRSDNTRLKTPRGGRVDDGVPDMRGCCRGHQRSPTSRGTAEKKWEQRIKASKKEREVEGLLRWFQTSVLKPTQTDLPFAPAERPSDHFLQGLRSRDRCPYSRQEQQVRSFLLKKAQSCI